MGYKAAALLCAYDLAETIYAKLPAENDPETFCWGLAAISSLDKDRTKLAKLVLDYSGQPYHSPPWSYAIQLFVNRAEAIDIFPRQEELFFEHEDTLSWRWISLLSGYGGVDYIGAPPAVNLLPMQCDLTSHADSTVSEYALWSINRHAYNEHSLASCISPRDALLRPENVRRWYAHLLSSTEIQSDEYYDTFLKLRADRSYKVREGLSRGLLKRHNDWPIMDDLVEWFYDETDWPTKDNILEYFLKVYDNHVGIISIVSEIARSQPLNSSSVDLILSKCSDESVREIIFEKSRSQLYLDFNQPLITCGVTMKQTFINPTNVFTGEAHIENLDARSIRSSDNRTEFDAVALAEILATLQRIGDVLRENGVKDGIDKEIEQVSCSPSKKGFLAVSEKLKSFMASPSDMDALTNLAAKAVDLISRVI